MVDKTRRRALYFFGADPELFDLVFVANATAGVKLVAEAFRDLGEKTTKKSFWYGYHSEVHSSILGVREITEDRYHCFASDEEVERFLDDTQQDTIRGPGDSELGLFAYPGQSNLSGRRLSKAWPRRIRRNPALRNTYSLFDAAALAMTCPLNTLFGDSDAAPDFTCLSLYKIFGFPDLGALIVRRDSGHILNLRKYFGGGTIAQVFPLNGYSHTVKKGPGLGGPRGLWSIHDAVEDGTLPFHSILALSLAIDTHFRLYGSMVRRLSLHSASELTNPQAAVSHHCTNLAVLLYRKLAELRYPDGSLVVELYTDPVTGYKDPSLQGAIFAFNVLRQDRSYVSWLEVERAANSAGVLIRAGGKLIQDAITHWPSYGLLTMVIRCLLPGRRPQSTPVRRVGVESDVLEWPCLRLRRNSHHQPAPNRVSSDGLMRGCPT